MQMYKRIVSLFNTGTFILGTIIFLLSVTTNDATGMIKGIGFMIWGAGLRYMSI